MEPMNQRILDRFGVTAEQAARLSPDLKRHMTLFDENDTRSKELNIRLTCAVVMLGGGSIMLLALNWAVSGLVLTALGVAVGWWYIVPTIRLIRAMRRSLKEPKP